MTKGKKTTRTSAHAGRKNLERWRKEHPHEAALKHGAWSSQVRQRYSDKRTTEGRQLAGVISGLIQDLGGVCTLSAAQRLILDGIRSKLIVLFQIGKYTDRQDQIINEKGEVLPCLARTYTTYSESLRRDLEALFSMSKKPVPPSYAKALKALQGGSS